MSSCIESFSRDMGARSILLIPLALCLLLVGRANIGRFARNVAIAVGLLVVGTALLFFALTFLPDPLFFPCTPGIACQALGGGWETKQGDIELPAKGWEFYQ